MTFEAGVPIAIDGEKVSMLQAIQALIERAGAQGVGRLDLVEDRARRHRAGKCTKRPVRLP